MSIVQILFLILGAVMIILSFVIPERKSKLSGEERRNAERQMREIMEAELAGLSEKVADMVDDTVAYAVEKAERSMEKLTNEKIMAVSEYSDTVLEDIHKNHEEVVFLYDMLNDKHKDLTSIASRVEKTAREVKNVVTASDYVVEGQGGSQAGRKGQSFTPFMPQQIDMSREGSSVLQVPTEAATGMPYNSHTLPGGVAFVDGTVPGAARDAVLGGAGFGGNVSGELPSGVRQSQAAGLMADSSGAVNGALGNSSYDNFGGSGRDGSGQAVASDAVSESVDGADKGKQGPKKRGRKPGKAKDKTEAPKTPEKAITQDGKSVRVPEFPVVDRSSVALSFYGNNQGGREDGKNNNQRILALHNEGKSNVAIARELGLGVGEVKLVIDLFK